MLYEEAKFIGNIMHALEPSDVFPMLNLGSSSDELTKQRQPWIDEFIFSIARASNHKVVNVDLKSNPGVDIVGDVTDPLFLEKLKKMGFKSIICSNMLEHVPTESVDHVASHCNKSFLRTVTCLSQDRTNFPITRSNRYYVSSKC